MLGVVVVVVLVVVAVVEEGGGGGGAGGVAHACGAGCLGSTVIVCPSPYETPRNDYVIGAGYAGGGAVGAHGACASGGGGARACDGVVCAGSLQCMEIPQ